jgi:hypothetical protein
LCEAGNAREEKDCRGIVVMKLFYYCYGGAHTSVTCASIHMGYLPKERIPEREEFQAVPFYDKMDNDRLGTPIYVGRDELGWDVYFMGLENKKTIVIPAIKSYLNTNHIPQGDILFVNALVELHPITSVGGVASRKFHLIPFGRPLTVWGIRRSYPKLVELVVRVKENLRRRNDFP